MSVEDTFDAIRKGKATPLTEEELKIVREFCEEEASRLGIDPKEVKGVIDKVSKMRFQSEDSEKRIDSANEEVESHLGRLKIVEKHTKKDKVKEFTYKSSPLPNVEPIFNKELNKVQFCTFESGNTTFNDEITCGNTTYMPPRLLRMMAQDNHLWLPSKPEEYESTAKLTGEIYDFLYKYADYDDEYRKLDVWYALFTWVYDLFPNLPYRRSLGDTGRGKSRWSIVLGSICRLAYQQGASTSAASIYRACDVIRGTTIIDENYFSAKTEQGQAILAILNSGYSQISGYVMKCVGDTHDPYPFSTYGPKLIAARRPFPDEATENRTISHFAYETDRTDVDKKTFIPIHLTEQFWTESLGLRNKLLMWRFRNRNNELKEDTKFLKAKINPRLKEVMYPLSVIIEDTNIKASLINLAEILNHDIQEVRSSTDEATVLSTIISMITEKRSLAVKSISDRIKDLELEYPQYFLTPKRLGWFLRNRLGLHVDRVYDREKNTNPYTVVLDDLAKIERLAKQYGVNEETITSITSITLKGYVGGESEEKASREKATTHLFNVIDVIEVIDFINWLKEVTQQGREAVSAPIVYGQVKQKFKDDFEKSMALLNWLTSENIITISSDVITFNLMASVFLEVNLKRSLELKEKEAKT